MSLSGSLSRVSGFIPERLLATRARLEQSTDEERSLGNFSVSVASSIEAIEKLRQTWELWSHHPQTDFEYYLHRLRTDSTIVSPCVLMVCEADIPQAILVGQIRKLRLSATVSFVKVHGPEARVLEIANGGRMGKKSDVIDGLLAMQLYRTAKCQGVDLALLQRLSLRSELFRALRQMGGMFNHLRVPDNFSYSIVQLTAPHGSRVPVFSGKNLRETRRKTRILQRAFPDGMRVRCFSVPNELEEGLRDATAISATTWQSYLGQGFLSDGKASNTLNFIASHGSLRVYVMYVNDEPGAFLIGQLYKERFYCLYAGYNPAFTKFSVGSLLTAWVLTNLATADVQEVDLGEGDQEHNRRLGCHSQQEGTVHVYFPTLRGLRLNAFFTVAQIIRAMGRKTITELRLNRLRKAWPQILISRWRARNRMSDLCS
jgi:CelD/BcsL family acetyltransferase involved in cellulose biosynthesis